MRAKHLQTKYGASALIPEGRFRKLQLINVTLKERKEQQGQKKQSWRNDCFHSPVLL